MAHRKSVEGRYELIPPGLQEVKASKPFGRGEETRMLLGCWSKPPVSDINVLHRTT